MTHGCQFAKIKLTTCYFLKNCPKNLPQHFTCTVHCTCINRLISILISRNNGQVIDSITPIDITLYTDMCMLQRKLKYMHSVAMENHLMEKNHAKQNVWAIIMEINSHTEWYQNNKLIAVQANPDKTLKLTNYMYMYYIKEIKDFK